MRFTLLLSLFLSLPFCLYAQNTNTESEQVLEQNFKVDLVPGEDISLILSHRQQALLSKNTKLGTEDQQNVLIISFDQLQIQRSWQKLVHPLINRALLYPSKKTSTRAYLKIRLNQPLTANGMNAIKIEEDQGKIKVLIPKSAFVAQAQSLPLMTANPKPQDSKSQESKSVPTVELSNSGEISLSNETDVKTALPPQTNAEPNENLPDAKEIIAMHENLADDLYESIQDLSKDNAVLVLPTINEDELKVSKTKALLSQSLMQELMSNKSHVLWLDEKRLNHYAHSLHRNQEEEYDLSDMQKLGKIAGADLAFQSKLSLKTPTQLILESKLYSLKDGSLIVHESHPLSFKMMSALEDDLIHSPTKGGAFWRSLILPGWGQIYGNQPTKGWAFLGAGLGLLAGSGASSVYGFMAEQDYNTFESQYAHRRADANMHYDRANLLLLGYGALWLSSLIDAYFSTSEETVVDHHDLHDRVQKESK
jgi:hypothetical protein